MAGREQQAEQALRAAGVNVTGLRVEDRGQVISVYGNVATDAQKQQAEQAIERALGTKVANHLTAQQAGGAAAGGGGLGIPGFPGAATGAVATGGGGGDVTTGRGQEYVVKSGDSLSKIAKQFYGDAKEWKRIYDVNRETIKNPDLIHPGQKLYIPQ